MSDPQTPPRGFGTRAIRVGQDADPSTGSSVPPIYQSATFVQTEPGKHRGFDYSRSANPTRAALERQLASLENVRFGSAFASGMAAGMAVASLLAQGDHIVAARDLYGGCHRLLTMVLPRWGITTTFVDTTDLAAVRAAITPATKMFWLETPGNPMMTVTDIAAIAALRAPGQLIAVDNTFSSPYGQQPIAHGADLSWHSTTKYISGHDDVVGGVVLCDNAEIAAQIAFHQNAVGAVPGPQDAFLSMRGVKTLALRMRAHEANAHEIASWLARHPEVIDVYYPGLPNHPQHALAKRQMQSFGGMISFRPRGGNLRAARFAQATQLFQLAPSLGGVSSLLCVPSIMTHGTIPPAEKLAIGVTDDLIRLSVGIEDVADLLGDLAAAFAASATS